MIFLGTGAGEGFPDPFCSCEPCQRAMRSGDPRARRRRSAVLLNERNIIDFGADVMHACAEYGCSLTGLRNVFLTHTHDDHFSIWNFGIITMSRTPMDTITVYLSEPAAGWLRVFERQMLEMCDPASVEFIENTKILHTHRAVVLEPYKEYEVDGMAVLPVKGRHGGFGVQEHALNYVFKTPEQCVFYACDTGEFFEETYAALKNTRLDVLILEGTFGQKRLPPQSSHMDQYTICETIDRLKAQGTVDEATRVYITHIAHHSGYNHDDYEAYLQGRYGAQIHIAYDGLKV